MTVTQLAQHLRGLAELLEASGGRTAAAELATLGKVLSSRGPQPLSAFTAELEAKGVTAPSVPPVVRSKAKKVPPDLEPLAREVQATYESASSPSVTLEVVEDLISRLGSLTKDNLVVIAERLGLKGMNNKSKGAVIATIKDLIVKRKSVLARATMTNQL
jgi:hypothetical protein